MTFTARYPGVCEACGDDIEPGDEVTYVYDHVLQHAECAEHETVQDSRITTIGKPQPKPREHPGNPAREFFD